MGGAAEALAPVAEAPPVLSLSPPRSIVQKEKGWLQDRRGRRHRDLHSPSTDASDSELLREILKLQQQLEASEQMTCRLRLQLKASEQVISRQQRERELQREELERERDDAEASWSALECVVCLDRDRSVLCVPCNHLAMCAECAKGVAGEDEECPICRSAVTGTIDVVLS